MGMDLNKVIAFDNDEVIKNFGVAKVRTFIGAMHIDFMNILDLHFAQTGGKLRTVLQRQFAVTAGRLKGWNNMTETPSLFKIEDIFKRKELDITFAIENLSLEKEESRYSNLIRISTKEADEYLCNNGFEEAFIRESAAINTYIGNQEEHSFGTRFPIETDEETENINARELLPNTKKEFEKHLLETNIAPSDLLRQFAYIYLCTLEKIDAILDENFDEKRLSTTAVINRLAEWNLGSMKRLLLSLETNSTSLEMVERFSEKVLKPLGYVIRIIPVYKEALPGYVFTPYNKMSKVRRTLIHF